VKKLCLRIHLSKELFNVESILAKFQKYKYIKKRCLINLKRKQSFFSIQILAMYVIFAILNVTLPSSVAHSLSAKETRQELVNKQ
jgi:hypothetical protein